MNRRQRRNAIVLAVLTVSSSITTVHGQAVDTWNGAAGDSLWPTGGNWSATTPPGTADTALFNGAPTSGTTTISLNGTTQTAGAIQFMGSTGYFIGSNSGDTLTLNSNYISGFTSATQSYSNGGTVPASAADGAIDMPSGATAAQEIDANITFTAADPFITNASAFSMTLGNANSPGVISLANGSALIPQITNTASSIVFNDAITGAGSIVLNNNSTKGLVVFNNPNSTYSGETIINSANGATIQINASTDTNSSSTFTKGPFGTSTIVVANSSNTNLVANSEPETIANPISLLYGFTVANAGLVTANSLTFAGPITTVSSGRTLTFNSPDNTEALGASPNSTTFSLGTSGAAITATGATIVLNDKIVDFNSSTHSALTYTISSSSYTGTFVVAGSNTYSGGTTFGTGPQQPVVDILSDSSADGTSGPFGSGTVTFNSSEPAILEPVGADRTIANPISLGTSTSSAHGFFAYTYGTTPYNLTLSGPITSYGGVSTNNMIAGSVLNLGSSTSPSIIYANHAGFAIQGQFSTGDTTEIYDNIVDGPSGVGSFTVQGSGGVENVNLMGASNTYTGGTTFKSGAHVTTTTNFSNGTLTLTNASGPATAQVLAQPTPGATAGVTVVPALSIDGGSSTPTSSVDLTNNGMIVQSGTPFSTIQADIKNAGASGFTGGGITSSLAAAVAADSGNTHKTAIGYASVSELGNPSTFLGVPITDSNSTLVRYTLAGDSNMDGTVNALDFNALATHFGTSGDWAQGDYNYDGNVDTNDFDLLADNYGDTIANAATSDQPASALGALVPEPTTLGLVGLSLLALRRRRNSAL